MAMNLIKVSSRTGPLEASFAYMASILVSEVLLSLLVRHKRTGLLLFSRSRSHLTRSRPLNAYKETRSKFPQKQAKNKHVQPCT